MKTGLLFIVLLACSMNLDAQTASVIKFPQLQAMMNKQSDTTYVFNFWATWCSPCVKEFPFFQEFSDATSKNKVKVIFISLDFKKDFEKAVLPFVKAHNVKNEVYLLDETDYNSWIDKVDSTWNGDLPSTLVINNKTGIHKLYPQEFTFEELERTIKPFIQ